MTIRRRKPQGSEPEFAEVNLSKGTITFRTAIMLMIFAATPPGQQVLKNFGLTAPPNEAVNKMTADLELGLHSLGSLKVDVASVKSDIAALKEQATQLKTDVSAVKDQATKLDMTLTGFRVDFEKYKKPATGPN